VSSGLNKDCKPYQIKWTADDGPTYPSYTGDKGGLAYACLALIVEYDTISLGAMVRAESRAVEENLEKESRAEARRRCCDRPCDKSREPRAHPGAEAGS
jgi:hypothetical protein